jgi:sec-independent protein translocase protein TatC
MTRGRTEAPESSPAGDPGGWEAHVEELRRRVIGVLAVFLTATLLAFALSEEIASFLMSPVSGLGVKLYTFAPLEKFMAHLHISVFSGMVATVPFFVLQAGLFVWPALRQNERRYAAAALFVAPALFFAGAAAAYSFFAPTALGFFLSFGAGDGVEALWSLREYLSLLSGLMIATGAMLQMPLVLLVLFALGVVSPKKAASKRPAAILLIFLAAAVLTPPDVTSQVMLGVPLYLLFELTLFVGTIIAPRGS